MSNIRNMNQANNPFWDFVASLQNGPGQFPFGGPPGQQGEFDPFDGQHWGQQFGPMPHRGRRHGPPGHGPSHRGPPPPPEEGDESFDAPPSGPHGAPPGPPPPGPHGHPHSHPRGRHGNGPRGPPPVHHPRGPPPPPELEGILPPSFDEEPTSRPGTPPTPPETPAEPHHHPHPHGNHRGHHRGGPSGQHHGPPHHHHHHGPPSPHRRGPPHHPRGGRFGPRGGHGSRGGRHGGPHHGGPGGPNFPFDLSALAEAFAPGLFNNNNNNNNPAVDRSGEDGTFIPDVDVFDTEHAYIIHASVPGAKKPDLDITYTAARNSISISGVIMRPDVDEEMMSALALDERKIGSFERDIKLDEKVKIDEEGISAKLEDGVLRVTVPKLIEEDDEEYVEVRKVALE